MLCQDHTALAVPKAPMEWITRARREDREEREEVWRGEGVRSPTPELGDGWARKTYQILSIVYNRKDLPG